MPLELRPARVRDLDAIDAIYDHYVTQTPVTFDVEPAAPAARHAWFEQFDAQGRHRLLVAEREGRVLGWACSHPFRPKAAYATSVETTIYLDRDATGQGLGSALYGALFTALADEGVHRAYAGITLPNAASEALHRRFGFQPLGTFREVGFKLGRFWDVCWYEKELG
ncbi:MAG: N-acetyltransferase [Deltaproteobacteria bacterium]|nr:N-acetyltransferase [Deltaproteobacteria bacterium]